jgi:glycosyltransferase involved in cell wall biosynthesis
MRKIFHFSNKPPFPLKDGGCVAISSVLKSLLSSPEIEVFHFSLSTHKHPFQSEEYPSTWQERMQMDNAFVNTKTDLLGALIYLIRNKSYNVARFYDKKIAEKIKTILDENQFDTAILESIYLLPYLELFKNKGIKVIVRAHNIEHQIWSSMAEKTPILLKRWYFNQLSKQLKRYEITQLNKVDGIISITEEDAIFFQQFEPKVLTTAIPTAVKTNFPPTDYSLSDFYFLGAMDWKPNIEGVQWFLDDVIPEGLKGTQFFLGGKGLQKKQYSHPDVVNVGEVENAIDFISQHGICIIPMHSGSGLKIKLLENMAMGKPIITTTEGVRGVDVEHEKQVLIADDPDEFRELMYRLHLDKKLRKKLGTSSKNFIENNYSIEKLTRRLIAFIKDI